MANRVLPKSASAAPCKPKVAAVNAVPSKPESAQPATAPSRRSLLALAAAAPLLTPNSASALPFFNSAPKGPALPPDTLRDPTLAYQFTYPTRDATGREIPVAVSRKPEKYSSAAPLTADARQRIVAELVSLGNGVTYAVFVGPVTGTLKSTPREAWRPEQVAALVLTDRSDARDTLGRRVSLASVETATAETRADGQTYYVYETLQQGSPNLYDQSRDTYRRSVCVTGVREGLDGTPYLFTLSLAGPEKLWDALEGPFRDGVNSFRMLEPGSGYVPPDKDPWMFF